MDRGSLWAIVHGIAKSWTQRNIHAYCMQNLEHLETELAIKKKKKKLHLPTNNTPKPDGFTGVINHIFKELTLIPHQHFQK